jgi:hypothetical protein
VQRWHPLRQWEKDERERDLAEVLRLEGRGDYAQKSSCHECVTLPGVYRCVDCEVAEMYCSTCMVKAHALQPLHCIKVSAIVRL